MQACIFTTFSLTYVMSERGTCKYNTVSQTCAVQQNRTPWTHSAVFLCVMSRHSEEKNVILKQSTPLEGNPRSDFSVISVSHLFVIQLHFYLFCSLLFRSLLLPMFQYRNVKCLLENKKVGESGFSLSSCSRITQTFNASISTYILL